MGEVVIYACDVGSIARNKFAWTSSTRGEAGSGDIEELVEEVVGDIKANQQIAIGFECPLFIPCPEFSEDVGKARSGDGDRAYTASVGASAAMTGLSQVAWILCAVHARCPEAEATTSWQTFIDNNVDLFIWEAFVTGKDKAADHIHDAYVAMKAFQKNIERIEEASCVSCPNPVSLAGAMILWSGMSDDLNLLHIPCITLRP